MTWKLKLAILAMQVFVSAAAFAVGLYTGVMWMKPIVDELTK